MQTARPQWAPLRGDEVSVVMLDPQRLPDGECLLHWLNVEEAAAMARLRFVQDRRAYAAAHALRRLMVGWALGTDPWELVFASGDAGRPVLASHPEAGLHFSHSRRRAAVACAVTRFAPVGVDVEPIEPPRAVAGLLEPFVAGARQDFFGTWVALEAFWKSQGCGLADDNPRIRFEAHSAGRCAVLAESGALLGQSIALPAPRGCAAAVALAAPPTAAVPIRSVRCASVAAVEQLCATGNSMKYFARSAVAA